MVDENVYNDFISWCVSEGNIISSILVSYKNSSGLSIDKKIMRYYHDCKSRFNIFGLPKLKEICQKCEFECYNFIKKEEKFPDTLVNELISFTEEIIQTCQALLKN